MLWEGGGVVGTFHCSPSASRAPGLGGKRMEVTVGAQEAFWSEWTSPGASCDGLEGAGGGRLLIGSPRGLQPPHTLITEPLP